MSASNLHLPIFSPAQTSRAGWVVAILMLVAVSGTAEEIAMPLTDDTFVNGIVPTANYASRDDLIVHDHGPKQALIRFNVAPIGGRDIRSATLKLYLRDLIAPGYVSVHANLEPWAEDTVTWNNQPVFELNGFPSERIEITDTGSWISIDVTPIVDRWADGSLPRQGFAVVTSQSIKASFESSNAGSGHAPELIVDAGPGFGDGTPITLDFNNIEDCTIDEPGHYQLDRNWDFSLPDPDGACNDGLAPGTGGVRISADNVILDMKGFGIEIRKPPGSTVREAALWTSSKNLTLRGGYLRADGYAINELNGSRGAVKLDRMETVGIVYLASGHIVSSDVSSPSSQGALDISGGDVIIHDSAFHCSDEDVWCVEIDTWASTVCSVTRNRFSGTGGIDVNSNTGCVIRGNLFDLDMLDTTDGAIRSRINTTIANNIIKNSTGLGKGIHARYGGQHIIVENLIMGVRTGILFEWSSPNVYGNNRISADTPLYGEEDQIDIGGNVTF